MTPANIQALKDCVEPTNAKGREALRLAIEELERTNNKITGVFLVKKFDHEGRRRTMNEARQALAEKD